MKEVLPPPSEKSESQPDPTNQNSQDVEALNGALLIPQDLDSPINPAQSPSQTIESQVSLLNTEEKVIAADQIPQLLATAQNVTLLSDLSQGQAEETEIPVSPGSVQRMLKVLQKKDIPYLKIAIGGVAVTVVLGYGIKKARKVKEKVDDFLEKKEIASLDDDQMENFLKLVSQNYDVVYRYLARNLINQPLDVEELTHDVFRRALVSFSKFTPREDLKKPGRAWLLKIAFNLLRNYYRSQWRKERKEDYLTKHADISELEEAGIIPPNLNKIHSLEFQIPEDPVVLERMRKLIEQLPNDRKQLICLKQEFGLTNAEIGFIMNRSEGSTKSLYRRTIETLRKQMASEVSPA